MSIRSSARVLRYNKADDGMTAIACLITRIQLRCLAYAAVLFERTPEAIRVYRRLIALAPRDTVARSALGNLHAESGDLTAAVYEFEQLVEIDPLAADAWFNLGFLHDKREELGAAERCFRKAVELKPSLDRAWYGLGLVLIRDGRLEEATKAFKRTIKLQPFSPYGYYQLAMTYHHLGRGDEAWKLHEQLADFEPKYSAGLKRDLQQTPPRAVARGPDEGLVSKGVATVEAM
ncbi:MAG TPA: tetratricopeptide repeat protein [Burkholderiaceae bacterium]|nr:tetratricopeptide repeat protein [Burkholderiaceae bacterium]